MPTSWATARADAAGSLPSSWVLSTPTRETRRSVTSGCPPAPRMSPRSASTEETSRFSPSTSDGSIDRRRPGHLPAVVGELQLGLGVVLPRRRRSGPTSSAASPPRWNRSARPRRCRPGRFAEPISCVIRSYDAWAVVAVSAVKATFDRSFAVSPDASAVAASCGSGCVGRSPSSLESPVQPATPRTRTSVRAAARDLVASCRPLYRPPPHGMRTSTAGDASSHA